MSDFDLLSDVYYSREYTSLYLKEGESVFYFQYQEAANAFVNISIKRPINLIGEAGIADGYFDLETAYGYGGHYATSNSQDFLCRAFEAYRQKCLDENIIAEFIRFHPYNAMPVIHGSHFDFVVSDRETVSVDLSLSKQQRWSGYSPTTRNVLRRSLSSLILNETSDIDTFMALYQSTMLRNGAMSHYYFTRQYYEKLLKLGNVKLFSIIFKGGVINMSFILIGPHLAHYHLSANDPKYSHLNGNCFFLDAVCDYLKSNYPKITHFHLGGGRTNSPKDTLLAFKAKFSTMRNNFYIAGKIFNPLIYKRYVDLCHDLHPERINTNYFLKYRML